MLDGMTRKPRSAPASRADAEGGRPRKRRFTAEYKLRILREADAALESGESGALGALLRREGIYSSTLNRWRAQRQCGLFAALTPKRRGPKPVQNPLADENARLRRQVARLEAELHKAEIVIDVQKKVAALLGNPIPDEPDDEEKP
jgi:transposase-like protein